MSRLSVSVRTLRLALFGLMAVISLLSACASNDRPEADLAASQVTTIGVNSYLWRATLDSLSFMPLTQTDSNGGVILTDWYVNPQNPSERMKLNISILDQDLRADALARWRHHGRCAMAATPGWTPR